MSKRPDVPNYDHALSDVGRSLVKTLLGVDERLGELEDRLDAVVEMQVKAEHRILKLELEEVAAAIADEAARAVADDEGHEDEDAYEAEAVVEAPAEPEGEWEPPEVDWPSAPGDYYVVAVKQAFVVDGPGHVYSDGMISLPEDAPHGLGVLVRGTGWKLFSCDPAIRLPLPLIADLERALHDNVGIALKVASRIVECAKTQGKL
ncbi:hypothetical protein [Actinomyces culturomici]|uniref:hypothetical protein n=1 Tax=Actinomyces culturomici TaxID=1926276 RepID=UPI000E201FBA|nr:hypothetical protein [Actinomyces culturomici]